MHKTFQVRFHVGCSEQSAQCNTDSQSETVDIQPSDVNAVLQTFVPTGYQGLRRRRPAGTGLFQTMVTLAGPKTR